METKERLLTAARQCLLRNGYAGTTVRDLVAESGANLASINYHFGSKEALLNKALFLLNSEWGEVLFGAVAHDSSTLDTTAPHPAADAEARWQAIIDLICRHRSLWFVNFETIVLSQHNEAIRAGLAAHGEAARVVLARTFGNLKEGQASEAEIHAVGSHYYSQLVGAAFQWLTDPGSAPTAAELAATRPARIPAIQSDLC